MRIINVVTIKEGIVDNITSFGVFEEQLSSEVVELAEKEFIKQIKSIGYNIEENDIDDLIEDGYLLLSNMSVCISWSDI